jgi:hypothetical protein
MAKVDSKTGPTYMFSMKDPVSVKRLREVKSKRWRKTHG